MLLCRKRSNLYGTVSSVYFGLNYYYAFLYIVLYCVEEAEKQNVESEFCVVAKKTKKKVCSHVNIQAVVATCVLYGLCFHVCSVSL